MHTLTILYDADCEFCQRCRAWAESQPQYLALRFIVRDSEQARRLCPQLAGDTAEDELVAISDDGRVYRNAKAWLMCLYALRNHRPLAMRLGRPGMLGLARRAFAVVILTEESAKLHVQAHRRTLPRQISQRALVAAVHAMGRLLAIRTACLRLHVAYPNNDLPARSKRLR